MTGNGLLANIANFVTEIYANRLTAVRAAYLDLLQSRLDAAVSSRADGSVWTSGRAANLDATVSSRATPSDISTMLAAGVSAVIGIRAINGITDGSGGNSVNNIGFAAVGAKAIVVSACSGGDGNAISAKLTSNTNLRLDFTIGAMLPYSFYVIDFR